MLLLDSGWVACWQALWVWGTGRERRGKERLSFPLSSPPQSATVGEPANRPLVESLSRSNPGGSSENRRGIWFQTGSRSKYSWRFSNEKRAFAGHADAGEEKSHAMDSEVSLSPNKRHVSDVSDKGQLWRLLVPRVCDPVLTKWLLPPLSHIKSPIKAVTTRKGSSSRETRRDW